VIRRAALLDRSVQQRDARLYVLAVEGAETEPAYFRALEARELIPRHRVKLHVVTPTQNASAPLYILGAAESATRALGLQPYDEVWLVYDVDVHSGNGRMQQVIETAQDAQQRGWSVAISNPCFELWLLLHVTDDVAGVTDHGSSVAALLKAELGAYSKRSTPDVCLLGGAIDAAIERARALDVAPAAPCPSLRSTRVYALMERLRRER
jgi:RloB-like protein